MSWFSRIFGQRSAKQLPPSSIPPQGTANNLLAVLPSSYAAQLKSASLSETIATSKIGKPVWSDWNVSTAIKDGYKSSTWAFACIYRLAKAVASVPWIVERGSDQNWLPVDGHPLADLVNSPNRFWSRQDLLERMVIFLCLSGNAVVTKLRVRGVPAELWLLSPDAVKPIPDEKVFIKEYQVYKEGKLYRKMPAEDVVHVQFTNPADPYWGQAPLQAAGKAVDTDVEASNWNKSALQNRAVADGAFVFKNIISQDQFDNARQMIRDQHGGSSNARLPWIVGSDASWHQMSFSPVDMDYLDSRKFNREEICSAFGVPPALIGIMDNATLANIETSRQIFWEDTVIPLLTDIRDAFNRALVPEFGETGLRLNFDIKHIPANHALFKQNVDTAWKLWNMGIPFNMLNQRLHLGFDEVPGGDDGYLPANMLPVGSEEAGNGDAPQGDNLRGELGEI